MDEINEELQQKSIEKSDNLQVTLQSVPKKTKKPRSQKQIYAFEKAIAKRAEQVAEIQKKKQLVKQEKKVKIKEFKETLKDKPPVTFVEEKSVMPIPARTAQSPNVNPISMYSPGMNQPQERHREQIVNNYYYYGPTPSAHQQQGSQGPRPITPPPAVRRQKPPPEPSSSEEEYYEEEPLVQQEPKFQYQYNYV